MDGVFYIQTPRKTAMTAIRHVWSSSQKWLRQSLSHVPCITMISSLNDKKSREFSESFSETGPGSSRTIVANFRGTGLSQSTDGIRYKARTIDIWALGITIVIGGQYSHWNSGLTAGFGSYATGILLIGTAYICLCFCTSELSSALPFAGSMYQTSFPRIMHYSYCAFLIIVFCMWLKVVVTVWLE